jgi:hypothetical protein
MSSPMQTPASPSAAFQAQFGAAPGTQDARSDCDKWERLCAALLEERARLQAELATMKAENAANLKALTALLCKDFKFELTMEEVYAQVDKETSLGQLVAELAEEAKKT